MTDFKGNLGNYKIIKTEDNTETLYSEYFDEACHNLSGAYEETVHNYILGCHIPDLLLSKKSLSLLDVGFGLGIGLKAFIDQVDKLKTPTQKLFYYSVELDEVLALWSLQTNLPMLTLEKRSQEELNFYFGVYKNIDIFIFIGDARVTLPRASLCHLLTPFDAIFQDAFSPKKNPSLWSVEWFHFLKEHSLQSVHLSTYSSSISIRKSLLSAGWSIENAKGFALKKTMTKANLLGHTSSEIIDQMNRSPSLEIRDK